MSDSNQRKTGAILSYVAIIINTVIQFLYTPLLIRMLGQGEYGLYSLVSSIIAYLTVLDLGFGNAIVVYSSKYRARGENKKEKKLLGMFKLIYFIISCIALLLGLLLFLNTETFFGNSMSVLEINKLKIMMLILTFNLFISFNFSIYQSVVNSYEKFIFQKIISIVGSILKPCIMIPLLFMGFKSISLTIVITIVNIAIMLSNYLYTKNKLRINIKYLGFDKKIFKEIIGYSFFIFLCTIVDQVNHNVDQFILGTFSGSIAVSVYSLAMQINLMFLQLSTAISNVFLPKTTKMVASGVSTDELTNEFIKVGRLQFYIMYLICTGFVLVGMPFIRWWAGPGFDDSYYVTLLLIIPSTIPLIQNMGLNIMQAMNKYKFKAITTSVMAIFNIIISIYLVSKFGAIGAAVGTCIAVVICNVILINIYYYKEIKLDIIKFWKNIIVMLFKLLIPLVITILIMCFTNLDGLINVIVYGGIYSILYIITAYFIVMNEYEKEIINKVLRKLRIIK
ncbi:MAG: virulence factor MviN [Lactobacillales bacterium]|nr:virulence factor MviN [Lactobacillales bacterium]